MQVIYRNVARICLASGGVFAPSEGIEGVICVSLRGKSRISLPLIREGFRSLSLPFRLMRHVPLAALARRASAMGKATAEMRRHIRQLGECIYVDMVAVASDHRERKFMSRMMRAVLAEADRLSLRCILETEEEQNVEMYKHFRFRLDKTIEAIPGVLNYYIMVYNG
jgi:hypothetical protein